MSLIRNRRISTFEITFSPYLPSLGSVNLGCFDIFWYMPTHPQSYLLYPIISIFSFFADLLLVLRHFVDFLTGQLTTIPQTLNNPFKTYAIKTAQHRPLTITHALNAFPTKSSSPLYTALILPTSISSLH